MTDFLNELKGYLLGDLTPAYYAAAFIFCSIAIIISLRHHSRSRDILSPNTPILFSWKFLLWDNVKRVVTTLLLMFLFFRFSPDIFGAKLSFMKAVGIGIGLSLGLDKSIQYLQENFNIFKMPRK